MKFSAFLKPSKVIIKLITDLSGISALLNGGVTFHETPVEYYSQSNWLRVFIEWLSSKWVLVAHIGFPLSVS